MSVLTLNNVTYKYEGVKKNVLKGVSAEFEAGKVYTIVGSSAAANNSAWESHGRWRIIRTSS